MILLNQPYMKINKNLENLVYLYILVKPDVTAEMLFKYWHINRIFKEYNRPPLSMLEMWYAAIFDELEQRGIKSNLKN